MKRLSGDNTSLLAELFFTPRGWAALVSILAAGAGLVLYAFGAVNIPERLAQAEAAVSRMEEWHKDQGRKVDWLLCTSPQASPDRLLLLGVKCWELPASTMPLDDGPR